MYIFTLAHTRAYIHTNIYISGYFFETQTPPIFFMKDFLTKLFRKIVWFIGYKVITLHTDTWNDQGNNGNEGREMYPRARKQRKRVARYTRYLNFWDNC